MTTKPRTKNELSSDETSNYWAAYFIVSDALALCREKLRAQENNATDPATRGLCRAAGGKLDTHIESMQTMKHRFNDGRSKVTPPAAEQIRSLAMVSAKVTGFSGDPARLAEVIELTTDIVTKFQTLQEP